MDTSKQYPATLSAVARAEQSLWPVVAAVVAEIEVTASGVAKKGEQAACAAYLKANGFASWGEARIQQFFQVGRWLELNSQASEFRSYPFEWVLEAKNKAKSDHEGALLLLKGAKTKRDIRPDAPPKLTPSQLEEQVAQASPGTRARIATKVVREDAEAADAVVADGVARMRVTTAAARQAEANRSGSEAEGKAKRGGLKEAVEIERAIGRVEDAIEALALIWDRQFHTLPAQVQEDVRDQLHDMEVKLDSKLATIKGEGVDSAISQILGG